MVNKGIRIGGWELFGLLILASALVHFLFIFFFPAGHLLRGVLFKEANEPTTVSAPMVFEFVAIGDEVEELVKEEEGWKKTQGEEEQKEEEEEVEETKRQQFVDTADSAVDEEVEAEADTDKIGEKGTLARDTAPDEGPAEEGPKLEGDTDIPAIGGPPGLGPGYTGGFAEMLADVVNEQEIVTGEPEEFEETEETGDADSTIEGEDSVAEAESEEAPSETMASDETSPLELEEVTQPDEVVAQETPTAETSAEEVEGTEAPEEGSYLEKKLGLIDEELQEDKDGLITIQKKPKELAYIPPTEPRKQDTKKARKKQRKTASKKAKMPKVAISFNTKTLSGGTIEPLYDNKDANAAREGQEAFAVMKDLYAPYYRHIRDRISWYWILKYGTRAEINLETKPNTPIIIEFKVHPNGKIKTVEIIDGAGNKLLASYIRDSITETRLNKFPSYVEEEFLDIRFNFYFF